MEAPQQPPAQFDWAKLTHVLVTIVLTTLVTLQNTGMVAPVSAPVPAPVAVPAPPVPCQVMPSSRASVRPVAAPDAGAP